MPRHRAVLLIATVLAASLVACTDKGERPAATTPPAPPAATTPPAPPAPVVTLRRSGGLAGVAQTVQVQPDGSWTYVDVRQSAVKRTGELTADQRKQLRALAASDELAKEGRVERKPVKCNDGFVYQLDAGAVEVGWSECGDGDTPDTAATIAGLLTLWTPM
jgi:hypothetical protein